ncbi:MAG: hypothetical protein U1E77_19665 [Inhella sp.]
MAARVEHELQVARAEGPAGQHARQLGHVLLAIAGAHAQGVQLHQLARVVLVQAAAAARTLEAGAGGLGVVQVEQHGRVGGHGTEQVAEAPEHMGADGAGLVVRHQHAAQALVEEDVEVVEPEVHQAFFELVGAFQRAQQARLGSLVQGLADQLTARRFVFGALLALQLAKGLGALGQVHGGPGIQALLQGGGQRLRLQLLLQQLQPAAPLRQIARARPVAQAVAGVQGLGRRDAGSGQRQGQ